MSILDLWMLLFSQTCIRDRLTRIYYFLFAINHALVSVMLVQS